MSRGLTDLPFALKWASRVRWCVVPFSTQMVAPSSSASVATLAAAATMKPWPS
ncbi:MAG: hypothetical protein AW07_04214 [Candidatus Accumulibacter sp. SK-11]|nr:MAG: hypothetical protein AW07_04214 [Candidatus Accumulibacter sp. SK-11]